jgi:hypothetical protein
MLRKKSKRTRSSSAKHTNPKDVAASTRVDLSLVPASALAYCALALVEGDLKYGGFNYRVMGVLASVYVAAAMRHIMKWFHGEDCDPRTKVPHLASALASITILVDGIEQGNLNDDRPPRQSAEFFDRLEANMAHLQTILPRRTPRYRQDRLGRARPTGIHRAAR